MGSYLMMLYVTLDQEEAVKNFFQGNGWCFMKPDLSVTTDKTGPLLIQETTHTEFVDSAEPSQTAKETGSQKTIQEIPKPRISPKRSRKKVKTKAFVGLKRTENAEFQEILQEAEIIAASVNQNETQEESETDATEVKVEQDFVVEYNDNFDEEDNFGDYDDYIEKETDSVMPSTSGDKDASVIPEVDPASSTSTPTATKKRKVSGKRKSTKDEEDKDWMPEDTPVKDHVPKRKRMQYNRSNLQKAFAATKEGMPVYRAARVFEVPASTLRDRTLGRVPIDAKLGFNTAKLFSDIEEQHLAEQIKYMTECGKVHSNKDIQQMAKKYAVSLGKEVKASEHLSNNWFNGFKQRWPEMIITKSSNAPEKMPIVNSL